MFKKLLTITLTSLLLLTTFIIPTATANELDGLNSEKEQGSNNLFYDEPQMQPFLNPSGEPWQDQAKINRIKVCFEKKVKNNWKEVTTIGAMTTVWTAVRDARYRKAAEAIIKTGAKGNALTIGATLTYYYTGCVLSS